MSSLVTPQDFDAVLFDLDGVLTTTRTVHAAAWKRTFDEFLAEWDAAHGTTTPRFDDRSDYASHVDGKPRQDGVRDFLASRGIELPAEGTPDVAARRGVGVGPRQPQAAARRGGAANAGVEVFPGSVAWVRELREAGLRTACRVEQPQLRRRPGASRHQQPLRHPSRRRDRARARPARQAGTRRVPGGRAAPRRVTRRARRGRGRPRRRGGRPGGRVRAGHRRRPGRARRRARDARRRPRRRRPRRAAGGSRRATSTVPVRERTGCWPQPGGSSPRPGTTRPTRGGSSSAPTTPTTSSRPRRCSRCRTATSASGAPSRRASRRTSRRTLLNGFHETWPIVYPETAHGFATDGPDDPARAGRHHDPAARRRGPGHLRDHGGPRVRRAPWTCSGPCSTARSCTSCRRSSGSGSTANGSCRWPSGTWRASGTR